MDRERQVPLLVFYEARVCGIVLWRIGIIDIFEGNTKRLNSQWCKLVFLQVSLSSPNIFCIYLESEGLWMTTSYIYNHHLLLVHIMITSRSSARMSISWNISSERKVNE